MITITDKPARITPMLTNRERLADFGATQTGLRCTTRINFHEHAPGTLSLVREIKEKVRPPGIINRFCEHPARESLDIQIFDRNQPVLINNLPRFFVVKIPALIANTIVESLKKQHGFAPSVRSLLTTRNTPLKSAEFSLRRTEPMRIINFGPVAQRSEGAQSNINTDHVWVERQRLSLALNSEQGEPTPGFTRKRK